MVSGCLWNVLAANTFAPLGVAYDASFEALAVILLAL